MATGEYDGIRVLGEKEVKTLGRVEVVRGRVQET